METVEYKNIAFTVWDVGGQDKVGKCVRRGLEERVCGLDSSVMASLLPEHAGVDFCGGQQ